MRPRAARPREAPGQEARAAAPPQASVSRAAGRALRRPTLLPPPGPASLFPKVGEPGLRASPPRPVSPGALTHPSRHHRSVTSSSPRLRPPPGPTRTAYLGVAASAELRASRRGKGAQGGRGGRGAGRDAQARGRGPRRRGRGPGRRGRGDCLRAANQDSGRFPRPSPRGGGTRREPRSPAGPRAGARSPAQLHRKAAATAGGEGQAGGGGRE